MVNGKRLTSFIVRYPLTVLRFTYFFSMLMPKFQCTKREIMINKKKPDKPAFIIINFIKEEVPVQYIKQFLPGNILLALLKDRRGIYPPLRESPN